MKGDEIQQSTDWKMPLSNLTIILQLVVVPVAISLFVLAATCLYLLTE